MRFASFGPYRLNLDTGDLQRSGHAIRLQPQPAKLLVLLVERAGTLVTREEITRTVWGTDTFVDFDQGVHFCVRQIRASLHDQADTPCYLETVPRRGYRFIAPVAVEPPPEDAAGPSAQVSDTSRSQQTAPPIQSPGLSATDRSQSERSNISHRASRTVGQRTGPHTRVAIAFVCLLLLGGSTYWLVARWLLPLRRDLFDATATPLTTYPGIETEPSLSPDGNQVAFVWNGPRQDNFDIYVKLVGPGDPIRLTTASEYDDSPAWSPDGKTIAFLRVRENNLINGLSTGAIYVIPALGGAERRIASVVVGTHREGRELSWTPDGKWLVVEGAFSASDSAGTWLLGLTGGERRRLTSAPAQAWRGETGARIAPDGRRVAFIRRRHVDTLFVAPLSSDLTAGEPVLIESDPSIEDLAWAPDSLSLIYASARGTGGVRLKQLWLDEDSTLVRAAEFLPFGEGASTVSLASVGPLVYSVEFKDTNLWKFDLSRRDSAPEDAGLAASTHDDYTPAYSADGEKVAFASTRSGAEELWVSNTDGTGLRQVTFMGGPSCADPQWSPDGRTILFHSSAQGSADVYALSPDSLETRRLTTDPGEDVEPKWSRDGQWIYFGSNRSGRFEVWKMRAEGGPATQLTHDGGLDAQESSDGRFVYYAEPQSPTTIWRMPVGGGEAVQIVNGLSYPLNFIVADDGIYFIAMGNRSSDTSIEFFDFRTGMRTRRAFLGKPWSYGIGLSPDHRWLLFPTIDKEGQDLMMVKRIR